MTWRQPESRTPPARLGDKSIATREDKWIGDRRRARHHQPDWETNQLPQGKTNELETGEEPDTTSQTGRQINCHKGRQMNWRQAKSQTPPARLGDKSIATREDKWIGDRRRARHHQPDWETNQLPQGKTNELETADSIESRTPPARLGDKWIATREDTWIGDRRRAGHHQPDWETNESLYWETKMNWRQPKSRTPLARLGDKCIATRGNKWIGDSRRPGHHQPSWIETGRKPDATSQTGRQKWIATSGKQITWT